MKKWKGLIGIVFLLIVIFLCQKMGQFLLKAIETKSHVDGHVFTIAIDAGHGSKDPGKVSASQILEKDINLAIAKYLQSAFEANDMKVVMVRDSDEVLGDTKAADLRERVTFINQTEPDLAISIHQNSYTAQNVKGAQVFYHKESQKGKMLAEILQESLRELDSENTRQAKADGSYYLLKNTKVPLVIVECGFLSNVKEAERLNSEEYQKKIAEAICSGVIDYIRKRNSI